MPPEAHREPSGDTVTVLMYPVWPRRSDRSLQFVRFHTCGRAPWQSQLVHSRNWWRAAAEPLVRMRGQTGTWQPESNDSKRTTKADRLAKQVDGNGIDRYWKLEIGESMRILGTCLPCRPGILQQICTTAAVGDR